MRKRELRRFVFESGSADATRLLGESIGKRIDSGVCIALVGVLGAGKTVFAGGVCAGLGVEEEVLSPTFVLYEEFHGRLPLVHVDLYRLEHEREIEELGLFDLLGTNRVLMVEWGDRSEYLLESSGVVVELGLLGTQSRTVTISCLPEYDPWFEGLEVDL
jgi:tRNA threonylcarbamoyladenosine biosynthesis protein TsaE